ncbi:Flowering time control protein FPA, partial [Bienertia sinuspersici]
SESQDKSPVPSRDQLYLQHRDELQPRNRSSAISPRESRKRHASSDIYFSSSPRTNERGTDHPTEILWIGFPSCIKVDESILRKAFSPFGDIDKITAFPGRTYAFVQFRNLASACRAKETLQGKLFGNPRVHISFARNEHASSAGGRRNMRRTDPPLQQFKTYHAGSSDNLRTNSDAINFSWLESPGTRTDGPYEDRRFHEHEPDIGPPHGQLGYFRSPIRDGSDPIHDLHKFQREHSFPENPRGLEDTYSYHGGKKLKIDSFPHEELPEYPLHNLEQDKHVFPGFVPEFRVFDESRPPLPHRNLPEKPSNLDQSLGDKHPNWRSFHDTFRSPPPTSLSIPVEWKKNHVRVASAWTEGMEMGGYNSKGWNSCLSSSPEFLDCTARTGLDMLAKHYYQATCYWVVFFVAASDADMGYYNEFMHYLGEKQRAAVAKLDERNTLFLVPPSDFSQNVLKIPGKLSISGVVLSLEPSSPGSASLPQKNEMKDRGLSYSHVDASYSKLQLPSDPSPIPVPCLNMEKPGANNAYIQGNIKSSSPSLVSSYGHGGGSIPYHVENRHDFQTGRPVPRDATLPSFSVSEGCNNSSSVSGGPEFSRVNYGGSTYSSGSKPSSATPFPIGGLQQEQHVANDVYRPPVFIENQHENLSRVPLRCNAQQITNQLSEMSPSPSYSQVQQQPDNVRAYSHAAPVGTQGSQEAVNVGNTQDDGEADPQKRLQATLQLAAALLQQIQQGKAP